MTMHSKTRPGFYSLARTPILVAVAAGAIAASSHIEVPFYPVPMTLQTLAILMTGLTLGLRAGGAAIALFLALGLAGAPVFAGGNAGPATLFGPTGGYLIGFAAAVLFCGWARDRGWTRSVPGACIAALAGAALVYPTGLLQLGVVIGWDAPVLELGLFPFVAGDIVKALIAGLGAALGGRALALGS